MFFVRGCRQGRLRLISPRINAEALRLYLVTTDINAQGAFGQIKRMATKIGLGPRYHAACSINLVGAAWLEEEQLRQSRLTGGAVSGEP